MIEIDGAPYKVIGGCMSMLVNPASLHCAREDICTQLCLCAEHLHVKPGKGAAFVRTKLKNAVTSNTVDKTFRAGESVASATVEKKDFQYTYNDGNEVMPDPRTSILLHPLDLQCLTACLLVKSDRVASC